jgi:hypothetical protein
LEKKRRDGLIRCSMYTGCGTGDRKLSTTMYRNARLISSSLDPGSGNWLAG